MHFLAGLQLFERIGIPLSKMVLGVPWYGYDYPCVRYNATVSEGTPRVIRIVANPSAPPPTLPPQLRHLYHVHLSFSCAIQYIDIYSILF